MASYMVSGALLALISGAADTYVNTFIGQIGLPFMALFIGFSTYKSGLLY
jgi:hypothetical protein